MKIKVIKGSALKGKGLVKPGDILTDQDADPIELTRLIAYGKAIAVDDDISTAKPTPDDIKNDILKRDKTQSKPMTTKSAGALKG